MGKNHSIAQVILCLAIASLALYLSGCGKSDSCGIHAEAVPNNAGTNASCYVLKDCNQKVVGGNCQ